MRVKRKFLHYEATLPRLMSIPPPLVNAGIHLDAVKLSATRDKHILFVTHSSKKKLRLLFLCLSNCL
ncbi:hypothetical protein VCHA34P115_170063 [Vibrio chagasii]|nr:hypothetical protein VCHA34P115_170063 [Vibrio chagasii]